MGDPAYLGASPDGVLVDKTGKMVGIVEIKCPYSAAKLSVQEACEHFTAHGTWTTSSLIPNIIIFIKYKAQWP